MLLGAFQHGPENENTGFFLRCSLMLTGHIVRVRQVRASVVERV
jgi:hypothetical protein